MTEEALIPTGPQALVERAIDQGASVEVLEKLLEMQLTWEANEARKAFSSAMAAFKANCPPVLGKDKRVHYKSKKTGATTSYHHTTLGAAVVAVTPYLSAEGLSVTWETGQPEDHRTVSITAIVSHKAGHSERTTLVGPLDASGQKNNIQQLGSSVTYLQRYTLLAALGIATANQDDDAVAMSEMQRAPTPSREPMNQDDDAARMAARDYQAIVDEPMPPGVVVDNGVRADLDAAMAECRWDDAFGLCESVPEVRNVARALSGQVPDDERERLLGIYQESLRRCSDGS